MAKKNNEQVSNKQGFGFIKEIIVSLITAVVLSSVSLLWDYFRQDVVKNSILIVTVIMNVWLIYFFFINRKKQEKQGYISTIQRFSTLADDLERKLDKYAGEGASDDDVRLLHWVPTFSLSRAMKNSDGHIIDYKSHTYTKLRANLCQSKGAVVCFDGFGIYKFLYVSRLFHDNIILVNEYLQYVIAMFKENSIRFGFLSWGLFPYTLILIGNECAIFDFTGISDITDDGFEKAKKKETLRLETDSKLEVMRVRRNMFDSIYKISNHSREARLQSIKYIEFVIKMLSNELNKKSENALLIEPETLEKLFKN